MKIFDGGWGRGNHGVVQTLFLAQVYCWCFRPHSHPPHNNKNKSKKYRQAASCSKKERLQINIYLAYEI